MIVGYPLSLMTYDFVLRPEPITRTETATMVDLDYEFQGIIKYYGRPVFIRTDNGSVVPAVLPGHLPLRLGESVIVKVVLDERGRVAERVVTGYEIERRPASRQGSRSAS